MILGITTRTRDLLWERSPRHEAERVLMLVGRYLVVMGRDLLDGQLSMRAMSLVYTTLLSLVPVLALGVSLFKAFGIHNALEPALANLLAPLGPQGAVLTANIIGFVENIKIGVLGSVGLFLLFFTVYSMLQKIESSFNFVWRIEVPRRLWQRVGEYLSVVIVGPLMLFLAVFMTASALSSKVVTWLASVEPFGAVIFVAGKLIPYVLVIGSFTFLYAFIPNTRVRVSAALVGGTLAGLLWQTGSAAFAAFVASATNYNAIYSGFAIVIFLLFWLYLAWLILLTGCQLSFYVQYPERLTPTRVAPLLSARRSEQLGLAIVGAVGRAYIAGESAPTLADLRRALDAPPEHVDRVVTLLLHRGLLAETGDWPQQLLPGRDLSSLGVAELWRAVRRGYDEDDAPGARDPVGREVAAMLDGIESGFAAGGGARSVREWLAAASALDGGMDAPTLRVPPTPDPKGDPAR